MVNFNPNIYYSDKACKAQERYQKAKKETENFSQNDQTTTATLILDHFDSEENKKLKDHLTNTRKQDDTLSVNEHTTYANALESYQTNLPTALYDIIKEQDTFTVDLLKQPKTISQKQKEAYLMAIGLYSGEVSLQTYRQKDNRIICLNPELEIIKDYVNNKIAINNIYFKDLPKGVQDAFLDTTLVSEERFNYRTNDQDSPMPANIF